MGNFLGSKHWIGLKKQAVAGTGEATVATFLPTTKIKMNSNQKPIARKAYLGTAMAQPSRLGWISPTGSATCEVHASQPHPWYWALGNVVTSTPAAGVSLHTITDGGAPIGLTAHANRVYDYATQADVYINKLKLTAKPGEIATLEIDWLALSHADGATVTDTPAFTTDVLTCRSVSVSIGGAVSQIVSNAEIDWDGGLDAVEVLSLTGGSPQVIRRKSTPKVSGKLDFIDFPTAELAKLTSAAAFSLVVELDGDVISSTYRKFLRITLPAAQYTGGLDTECSDAVITGSANFEAFYDAASARQILVEAQNTITDLTV
jgi:hypothetical protein